MRIALTGNPNSGKTTMYNALTGRNEKVGNWAGVTVEKKEHPIKKAYCSGTEDLIAVDLPGAYSMSPFTSEESITSSYVKHEHPDAIINIVDATNLSRSLFFTTQLLELGIPVVVALNKSDINAKKQTVIDVASLSAKLGCPVVETVSTAAEGLKAVVDAAVAQSGKIQRAPYVQGDIDLTDKKVVEEADRKRFAFVNSLVSQVEKRKVLTKDKALGNDTDFEWLMIDASHVKVHPDAAGARGGNQAMSRTKGGSTPRYIWPWMRMVCRCDSLSLLVPQRIAQLQHG